eukprot:XP_019922646.1 PREDICTED: kunitz-type serine protease inhibitor A-like [Crassostrea gigas]
MALVILHFLTVAVTVVIASHLYRPIPVRELKNEACGLPPVTGACKANVKRYYFDPMLNECKEFDDGECSNNDNNFQDKDLCEYICQFDRPCTMIGCLEKACTAQTCPTYPDAKCFAVCECESFWILDGKDVSSKCMSNDGYRVIES